MPQEDLIVGLDIGTTKICAIIGQIDDNGKDEIDGDSADDLDYALDDEYDEEEIVEEAEDLAMMESALDDDFESLY